MIKKISLIILSIFILIILIYYFYPETSLPKNKAIDKIVVVKHLREMSVYSNGDLLKTYKISLGSNPTGDKKIEGDSRTPDGIYFINEKNLNSGFHKNLSISYPDSFDRIEAKKIGKNPGGNIKIHGLRNGFGIIGKFHIWIDWTAGCIAVTNEEIDEIFDRTSIGTIIEIKE